MICYICKKNTATLHIKDIFVSELNIDTEEYEVHLCKDCVDLNKIYEKYIKLDESILYNKVPSSGKKNKSSSVSICKSCGYSLDEFKNTNKLSCPLCYKYFLNSTLRSIKRIHGNNRHVGRVPYEKRNLFEKQNNKKHLEDKLNELILKEEYEEAVIVRDTIKKLDGI